MIALLDDLLNFSHGRSVYLGLGLLALVGALYPLLWRLLGRTSYGAVSAASLLVAAAVLATRPISDRPVGIAFVVIAVALALSGLGLLLGDAGPRRPSAS